MGVVHNHVIHRAVDDSWVTLGVLCGGRGGWSAPGASRYAGPGSFVAGRIVSFSGTSTSPISLGAGDCTDIGFSIHTASTTLGTQYRLRLIHASTSAELDSYAQYPTFTMESAADIRFSKQAIGGVSTSTLASDAINQQEAQSIAIKW